MLNEKNTDPAPGTGEGTSPLSYEEQQSELLSDGVAPPCLIADPANGPGARLYALYNRAGDPDSRGLNYAGKRCPQWRELPENVRAKWNAVADGAETAGTALDDIAKACGAQLDPMIWPDMTPELQHHIVSALVSAVVEAFDGRPEGAEAFYQNANRYLPEDHPMMMGARLMLQGLAPEGVAPSCQTPVLGETTPANYLLGLPEWDGVDRLPTWLSTYLGADDTYFHRDVGVKWAIGAVARGLGTGACVEGMLVLQGAQGTGKSAGLKALGGLFFEERVSQDIQAKDSWMPLHEGKWFVEWPDLSGREDTEVKSFLTRQADRFRLPFEKSRGLHSRRGVFVGTTSNMSVQSSRRFWVVETGAVDVEGLATVRDQLWAEALCRYRQGESWWIDGADGSVLS